MADSDDVMARLGRLENAFIQVADVLVLQGDRFDGVNERFDGVNRRLDALEVELRTTREALVDRLDRLIAVTTRERTLGIGRLADLERRLAVVEERLGI